MVGDLYTILLKCCSCSQIGSEMKHKPKLQLFRALEPFELVVINVLGPVP